MDCDDVTLLLATKLPPTAIEAAALLRHAAGCEPCRQLTASTDEQYRWVVRIPQDAVDDEDLLVLPIVDPIVFTTEEELARGGMGRITRARDRRLGREVAIKEVLDPSLRARFEREAMITASLQHPAIVPVYEAGTWPDGSAFYAMRLVSGGTLHDAIAKTTSLEERLALLPHIRALTEALAYAHSRRIVHRDLKPGNVLVGEFGETVVIDWGLAKELDRDTQPDGPERAPAGAGLTRVGAVLGTVGFMSPEQAAGLEVDERADVYALGAILYNVLAGHAPYVAAAAEAATAVAGQPLDVSAAAPTPIGELAPGAPADLRAIVERAMTRPATARYPTAQQMAEDLRRFEAGQLLRSREYGLRELLARWVRRNRNAVIAGGIALVVVAIVGIVSVIGIARSRAAERDARKTAEGARKVAEVAQHAAEQARGAADRDAIALLEEQGRDELLGGDHERALAYLSEAYRRGRDTVALRHLLAVASRDLQLADRVLDPADGEIKAIAFDGAGRTVTVQGSSLKLWDVGKPTVTYPIDVAIDRAQISPDGAYVAIVTDLTHLAVYDTSSGKQLWTYADAKLANPTLVFRANLCVVMSGWNDRTKLTEVRDVATGAVRASLATVPSFDAAISPNGKLVATAGLDGTVGVWDAATGRSVFKQRLAQQLTTITFLGNDRIVIGTTAREAWIWDLAGGPAVPLTGHHEQITVLAVNPYGDLIAVGDSAGGVRVWNWLGELLGESHDARGPIAQLVWSPDQSLLLGGGADKRVYVWEIPSLALRGAVTAFPGAAEAHSAGIAWSQGGARFATLGDGDTHAAVWRTPSGDRVGRFWSRASAIAGTAVVTVDEDDLILRELTTGYDRTRFKIAPAFDKLDQTLRDAGVTRNETVRDFVEPSADASRVLVWGNRASAIYDLTTGTREGEVPTAKGNVTALVPALSSDGKLVLEVDGTGARLVDPATHAVTRELAKLGALDGAMSPDRDRLVLVYLDDPPQLWHWSTGLEIPLHVPPVRHARFDRSGHRLALYGTTVTTVVDADSGVTLATLGGKHDAPIDDVRFDASGHRLAGWGHDRSVKLWDLDTRKALLSVEGVARRCFAVTDDGARFATGANDGTIKIWDSASGRLLEVLHSERGLAGLAWSADGTRLLSHALDEHATLWDVHLEQRSPAELAKLADRASGWMLRDGLLVPRRP